MPRNLIMVRGRFFTVWRYLSLIGAFWHPQYVKCILHALISVLLYVPFISTDSEKCPFDGSTWWLQGGNYPYLSWWLLWLQRCFLNSSWFILLCNRLNRADKKHNGYFTFQIIIDITGELSTIIFERVDQLILLFAQNFNKQVHKN